MEEDLYGAIANVHATIGIVIKCCGIPNKRKEWLKTVDTFEKLNGESTDARKIDLAYTTALGVVLDHIKRWNKETVKDRLDMINVTIKLELQLCSGAKVDIAQEVLSTVKRKQEETIILLEEQVNEITRDPRRDHDVKVIMTRGLAEQQLVSYYVDCRAGRDAITKVIRKGCKITGEALCVAQEEKQT